MRWQLSKYLTLVLAVLMGAGSTGEALGQSAGKPDVLFIAIDGMNDWTTLFDKRNPIKTPNLRRLAKRGTFFTRAYTAVPACNPSRTAVMTGFGPKTTGCYTNEDFFTSADKKPGALTIPEYFREHDYLAMGAGKVFHQGFNRGKGPNDIWDDFQQWRPARQAEQHNGFRNGPLGTRSFDWGPHPQKMVDEDTLEYVDHLLGVGRTQTRPLFLAAGIFKPHLPFYAPARFFNWYPRSTVTLPLMPPNDLADVGRIGQELAEREAFLYERTRVKPPSDPSSHERLVQSYQAAASYADNVVGRLLDKLDATGRAENTIIVLWSDHGRHLGDKQSASAYTLWEKATHVPLIIVAPDMTEPGTRVDQPVSLLNLFPTLVELCGLPPNEELDGHSLVPLLKNPQADWNYPALTTMGPRNHALRTERWRYIRYRDGSEELYDHRRDPWEWSNLADDRDYADVLSRLRTRLDQALAQRTAE
jgi:arylsulfatase A-like enzyme